MRVLVVGEAPNSTGGDAPLAGRAGARLADLMGLSLEEYLATFERVNLLDAYPGSAGKGAQFPLLPAMVRALELRSGLWTHYLLCGRRVAAAFGFREDARYLRWYPLDGKHYGVVPHPSGIVRWYNDPQNRARARRWLRRLARRAVASRELVLM